MIVVPLPRRVRAGARRRRAARDRPGRARRVCGARVGQRVAAAVGQRLCAGDVAPDRERGAGRVGGGVGRGCGYVRRRRWRRADHHDRVHRAMARVARRGERVALLRRSGDRP